MKNIETKIKDLQEIAEQTRASLKTNAYDFGDSASLKAFQNHIQTVFKDRLGPVKSYLQQNRSADWDEFTYENLSRRQQAVFHLAQEAEQRCRFQYPCLCIADEFVNFSAPCPTDTFNRLNRRYHVETAAALWILDQLRSSSKLDDALEFLPQSREELDRIKLPDITDSVHCDDLIRGMLYVIHYRNRGKKGFDETKTFMDDADATLTPGDGPSEGRKTFEAIIGLIDPDKINVIRDEYLADINQLTDSLLSVCAQLQDEINTLTQTKIDMIEREIIRSERMLSADDDSLAVRRHEADESLTITYTAACDTREEAYHIEEELQKAVYRKESFCISVMQLAADSRQEVQELLGDKLYSQITLPQIGDPYAACFGFLHLLDTDSDCVWIYNLPYIVLAEACRRLPWANTDTFLTQKETPSVTPEFYEAATLHPEQYITPPSKSVLNQRIVNQPFVSPLQEKISFSQLVYLMSGLVPPRGMPEKSYLKALFKDSGLSKTEVDILYEYLMLACSVIQRDENYVFIDDDSDDAQDDENTSPETDEIAQELRELKRENKKLKAMINKLEHRVRESAEALQNANDSLDEAAAELAELRSMIRKAEKEEEDYTTSVSFPYTAQNRAVVFGGHSSWSKAIKPLLPDVRFIDASAQPNTGLIMNADVVWIQTNALSHSSFYKIIDVIRTHHIELRYFKYASAEKCAEQFALEDMAMAEKNDA